VAWRRNLFAVVAASFVGFTGFTLVMPFLPLYIAQLGVADVGHVAIWAGLSLGATPAITAILSPFWGRLADRVGRKIMVERALLSFVVVMTALGFVTRAWHVLALRAVQGVFAGYGALTLAMAAESAPRKRMASAIGLVQTVQRLGPAIGPVIGGIAAGVVGLRRAFFVTAGFYLFAFLLVLVMYKDPAPRKRTSPKSDHAAVSFRSVLAFQNFLLLMVVIFIVQFVDRSLGPILPLYIAELGMPEARVPLASGVLFSVLALAAAAGNLSCGRLLGRFQPRTVIAAAAVAAALGMAMFASVGQVWLLALPLSLFGGGVGAAMTAAYTAGADAIPAGAHGVAFGFLTGAALVGLALSPVLSGLLAAASIKVVFWLDVALLIGVVHLVRRGMATLGPTRAAVEDM
jgi:MFS transporter, DHA1 family, multidrug resistance protein